MDADGSAHRKVADNPFLMAETFKYEFLIGRDAQSPNYFVINGIQYGFIECRDLMLWRLFPFVFH